MKRKIFSMILAVTIIHTISYSFFSQLVQADTIIEHGNLNDGITWAFDNTNTLVISGIGDMNVQLGSPNPPWYNFRKDIKNVVIKDGITGIASEAFCDSGVTSVQLPNTLTHIDSNAFENCINLHDIIFPDSLTRIGSSAFSHCGLKSVIIPENVINIESFAFSNCRTLERVIVSAGTMTVGNFAFFYCDSLLDITMNGSISIEDYCFYKCEKLSDIALSDDILSIGEGAFQDTQYFDNPDNWENGTLYINNALICSTNYSPIKKGTTLIADKAFCSSVVNGDKNIKIEIPNGVKYIGKSAFLGINNLGDLVIPESVIDIGSEAFRACKDLESVIISSPFIEIGEGVFSYCDNLKKIEISKGLTAISDYSFTNCYNLSSISFSDSITYIGVNAFTGCDNLSRVRYSGRWDQWSSITVSKGNEVLERAYKNSIEPEIIKAEIEKSDNKYAVTINAVGVNDPCHLVVALYDKNKLVGIECINYESDSIPIRTVTFVAENATNAKIFLWDSLSGMKPLCTNKNISIK